jgi:hypothetical protein
MTWKGSPVAASAAAAFWACSLALLAAGCVVDERSPPGDPAPDGGATPAPIPATGVALTVEATQWIDGSTLAVQVVVGNAVGGAPAPLVASAFSLETSLGAIVEVAGGSESACPAGVSVAPGASLGCVVAFPVPAGQQPVRVHYTADAERQASAELVACAPATPNGLCPAGETCAGGTCGAACSPEAPDGVCPEGERCRSGECVGPCSASDPAGWCDDGACVDGACVAGCVQLSLEGDSCLSCFTGGALDVCALDSSAGCVDAEACSNCFLTRSSCECVASGECAGCEAAAQAAVECLASECPTCVAP